MSQWLIGGAAALCQQLIAAMDTNGTDTTTMDSNDTKGNTLSTTNTTTDAKATSSAKVTKGGPE